MCLNYFFLKQCNVTTHFKNSYYSSYWEDKTTQSELYGRGAVIVGRIFILARSATPKIKHTKKSMTEFDISALFRDRYSD